MSSPVSRPPGSEEQEEQTEPQIGKPARARKSIVSFVFILVALLVVLLALFLSTLPQIWLPVPVRPTPAPVDDDSSVILAVRGKADLPQVPAQQKLLLEQKQGLSLFSTTGGQRKALALPGYEYNQSVSPILLSSGQIVYSGNGIWLTDRNQSAAQRIFAFSSQEVLTSLIVNDTETEFAWSMAPARGQGEIKVYAGTLNHFTQIYQQSAEHCPCLRPFTFLHHANTIIFSDDRGDHKRVYYGIWSLDLNRAGSRPEAVLASGAAQGPLALAPGSNTLLYARAEGFVPAPTDGSVPDEMASQSYANSLSLVPLEPGSTGIGPEQELIAMQRQRSNSAEYHWVTTPSFSPDGHTLVYILFSSDAEQPYERHNAIYMVTFPDASSQGRAMQPELLASSMADFIEAGPWLNNDLITLYADRSVYILDIKTNGLVKVGTVGEDYARIIGVVK